MRDQGETSVERSSGSGSRPASRKPEPILERGFLIVVAASLVAIVACLPFALRFDAQTDRQGPMYSDLTLMAWLQHLNLREQGSVVPVRLSHGDHAVVGGREFGPAPGVTVEVRSEGDGFCVHAANHFGDFTKWYCHDLDNPPERVRLSAIDQ